MIDSFKMRPETFTFTIKDADMQKLTQMFNDVDVTDCENFEVQDKHGNKAIYHRGDILKRRLEGKYVDGFNDGYRERIADEPKWIPCSERLPEEEGDYLCTSADGDEPMCVFEFYKSLYAVSKYAFSEYKGTVHPGFVDYDSVYGYYEANVIAWMPLPEAYKEGE